MNQTLVLSIPITLSENGIPDVSGTQFNRLKTKKKWSGNDKDFETIHTIHIKL